VSVGGPFPLCVYISYSDGLFVLLFMSSYVKYSSHALSLCSMALHSDYLVFMYVLVPAFGWILMPINTRSYPRM
jgi:hypothetical protein